jgi:hypothetical protein
MVFISFNTRAGTKFVEGAHELTAIVVVMMVYSNQFSHNQIIHIEVARVREAAMVCVPLYMAEDGQ